MTATDGHESPTASRPLVPEYGIPADDEGLLPWDWAEVRLERAILYWLATTRPDGRPHAMPTWGAWADGGFWFEGGLRTRRARNLEVNAAAVVHIAEGDDVVIVEGITERVADPDPRLVSLLRGGFGKYRVAKDYEVDPENWRIGGLWILRPAVAFGWSRYPEDATRWTFG